MSTETKVQTPYPTILVPVDYAGCAWMVVAHAGHIAAAFGSKVVLLYVVDLPPGVHAEEAARRLGQVAPGLDKEAHEELLALKAGFPAGVEVELRLGHGLPAEAILRACAELQADLLIMGTHGRTGLKRLLMGSVAEEVLRHAKTPVMVVRAPEGMPDFRSRAADRAADEASG